MRQILILVAVGLSLAGLPVRAATLGLTNGDFESGNLSGWDSFWTDGYGAGVRALSPTSGSYRAEIYTLRHSFIGASDTYLQIPSLMDAFFAHPPGAFAGITTFPEASALRQTVSVRAGETLSFDWQLMTRDPWYYYTYGNSVAPEQAIVAIDGQFIELANARDEFNGGRLVQAAPLSFLSYGVPVDMEWFTGWRHFSRTFDHDATFTLGFLVTEFGHNDNSETGMIVDNIRVPEPAVTAAFVWPALLLGRRRRHRG